MSPPGVRRSSRIPKQVAIQLVGSDTEGKVFSEQTKTVVLSRHGAGIVSQHKLSAEQELILRCVETNKEAEVRVVGQLGSQTDIYTYGVAFVDPNVDFWDAEFPPLTESEKQASRFLLQCSSCKSREMVEQSDLESDVYAINQGLVRYCKRCGYSTVWTRSTGAAEDESLSLETARRAEPAASPGPAPPEPAPAPRPAGPPENRRKHPRTKVNFKACIRRSGFEDDITVCEDMSRGGLRFKSRKRYFEATTIEVAVPYSPGAQSIFVPAQIVFVQELKEEKLFRCGVAYVRSPK